MSYNGELSDFPEHVVKLMLKRQVEQGNEENVDVFESCTASGKCEGGFDWYHTSEGVDFWFRVIECGKFDIIPKHEPTPTRERAIKAADSLKWLISEGLLTQEQHDTNLADLCGKLGELILNLDEPNEVNVYEQVLIARETGLIK